MPSLPHADHMPAQTPASAAAQRGLPAAMSYPDRLSRAHFLFFQELAMKCAGISLPDYKANMVHRRISKRLTALRLASFADYVEYLGGDQGAGEIEYFINAITTNKTEFFRESHHFDHLAGQFVPRYLERHANSGDSRLRIWSAGCSSGQEPYTIALVLAATIADIARRDVRVLATDIDTDMLRRGRDGVYGEEELEHLPGPVRKRFVDEIGGGRGCLHASIRSLVTFNHLNLHGPWPMKGRFDAIFCRNVIIYFDKPTQVQLFERFANQLQEGGHLYIGHSESLYRVSERFVAEGPGLYRKRT